MKTNDYKMLEEAYSQVNEANDFPPLNTTGNEWHKKGQTVPPDPKPDLNRKANPMGESSEPSLANRIDEVLEEWNPDLDYRELAMAIGEIFKKHYISQELPAIKFLSEIERAIKS